MDLAVIGLPQVGKTALLSLLTGGVSGTVGVARVPDPRLDVLAAMFRPRKVTPATMRLTELAAVQPARLDKGERNAFFEGVRRADALLHVVRAFPDPTVPHVAGRVDPLADARAVEEELLLADLERVESLVRRLEKAHGRAREEEVQLEVLRRCEAALGEGRPIRVLGLSPEAQRAIAGFGLLTAREELIALNLGEDQLREGGGEPGLEEWARDQAATLVPFSAKVEAEIAALPEAERAEFLAAYGLAEPGVVRLAQAAYRALGMISFLTAGEDEVRAWPVRAGSTARTAAGRIHSDIARGFIRAEVVAFEDLARVGDWKLVREQGLVRLEGQDYVVRDGDVIHFRFHV